MILMRLIIIFGLIFIGIVTQAQDKELIFSLDGKSISMFESKKRIEKQLGKPDTTISYYFGDEYKFTKYSAHLKSFYDKSGLTFTYNGNVPNCEAKDLQDVRIDGNSKIIINNTEFGAIDSNYVNSLFSSNKIYKCTSNVTQIEYTHQFLSKKYIYLIYCKFDDSGKLNYLTIRSELKRKKDI
jgi:hypothetical protein